MKKGAAEDGATCADVLRQDKVCVFGVTSSDREPSVSAVISLFKSLSALSTPLYTHVLPCS